MFFFFFFFFEREEKRDERGKKEVSMSASLSRSPTFFLLKRDEWFGKLSLDFLSLLCLDAPSLKTPFPLPESIRNLVLSRPR